jgi:hypothetical protein
MMPAAAEPVRPKRVIRVSFTTMEVPLMFGMPMEVHEHITESL